MGFGLGRLALLVENEEMKCFLSRKGDLDQTLRTLAILDGLFREGVNSSGSQQGFTEDGSPPRLIVRATHSSAVRYVKCFSYT